MYSRENNDLVRMIKI